MTLKVFRLGAWGLAVALTLAAHGQYSIDRHTIDGGGGFSFTGGFWSAVQLPGSPLLTITLTGNRAVVSWPSPSTGFLLQQNANLNTANWVPASEAVADNGTNRFIIVNPPAGRRFYRLFKP